MTLIVMCTILVMTSGWMNLPRARQVPHDPQFLGRLSNEASSILLGTDAKAKSARGTPVWSDPPRIVRMSNGMRLTFPPNTTDDQAAYFASEYHQLLNVEADQQRRPYLLKILAIWLATVLLPIAGIAASLIYRGNEPSPGIPAGAAGCCFDAFPYANGELFGANVRQRTEKLPAEGDNRVNEGAPANGKAACVREAKVRFGQS